jgi:hypothetical protein
VTASASCASRSPTQALHSPGCPASYQASSAASSSSLRRSTCLRFAPTCAPWHEGEASAAQTAGIAGRHQFSQAFKQRAKEACLPQIRLHDLRHTYATLALQAGIHVKVVSERLGHASVGVTLDTYSHTIPAMQETAAALVATLVLGQEDALSALPEPAGHPDGPRPSSPAEGQGADAGD